MLKIIECSNHLPEGVEELYCQSLFSLAFSKRNSSNKLGSLKVIWTIWIPPTKFVRLAHIVVGQWAPLCSLIGEVCTWFLADAYPIPQCIHKAFWTVPINQYTTIQVCSFQDIHTQVMELSKTLHVWFSDEKCERMPFLSLHCLPRSKRVLV